jgi:multimeric flavodoxin WrbA
MKILGISASPHGAQSQTLKLVKAVLDGANSAGAEVELMDACKLNICYCTACGVCYKTGECCKGDNFNELYKQMLLSNGKVWGAPNYFRSVTAQLKTVIDRMADTIHCQLFAGKYSCSVATGEGNYDQVTSYLDQLLIGFGSFVTGNLGAVLNQGPTALEEAEKKAFLLGKALVEDIKIKRDYADQRQIHDGTRKYFQTLVKMHGKEWPHEYAHYEKLGWK